MDRPEAPRAPSFEQHTPERLDRPSRQNPSYAPYQPYHDSSSSPQPDLRLPTSPPPGYSDELSSPPRHSGDDDVALPPPPPPPQHRHLSGGGPNAIRPAGSDPFLDHRSTSRTADYPQSTASSHSGRRTPSWYQQQPPPPHRPRDFYANGSESSQIPLAAAATGAGWTTPPLSGATAIPRPPSGLDGPYERYASPWDPRFDQNAAFHPDDIADDGDDDGFEPSTINSGRRSVLGIGRSNTRGVSAAGAGAAAAGSAAAAGNAETASGGLLGRMSSKLGPRRTSAQPYGPVAPGEQSPTGPPADLDMRAEKSRWLAEEAAGRRRKKWIVITLAALLFIAIVVGATVGGILGARKSSASGGNKPAAYNTVDDGTDLNIHSSQIQQLMNNPGLHRVMPGVDYTPYGAQYPDCLTWPPSQNNVTQDVAVLSQLTNTIRLYGTDCNQTQMVLHAIDQLQLTDMKVWAAVWLDTNTTTNARGMRDLFALMDQYGSKPFAGVIVGNEVLFRKAMTLTQLASAVDQVRGNLTKRGIDLPIAVADLGDNWQQDLVSSVDVVMSNIHPFFAGVTAEAAAGWTWDFWQQHDIVLTTSNTTKKNVVSEVGWPSGGGNDCGAATCTSDTQGSIAGIDEMNTFMGDYICQSLKNGTDFFWFEAFDAPWQAQFNSPGKEWEDKWGLMDSGRNLKSGLKIPDCGGQTISSR